MNTFLMRFLFRFCARENVSSTWTSIPVSLHQNARFRSDILFVLFSLSHSAVKFPSFNARRSYIFSRFEFILHIFLSGFRANKTSTITLGNFCIIYNEFGNCKWNEKLFGKCGWRLNDAKDVFVRSEPSRWHNAWYNMCGCFSERSETWNEYCHWMRCHRSNRVLRVLQMPFNSQSS